MPEARYKGVLLRLSGEALSGQNRYGIDNPTLKKITN
jgi:uridylate kinase